MKVTCSSSKVRDKLDIIREKHDQGVLDLKKGMSTAQEFITEKASQVTMLDGNCRNTWSFIRLLSGEITTMILFSSVDCKHEYTNGKAW